MLDYSGLMVSSGKTEQKSSESQNQSSITAGILAVSCHCIVLVDV